MTMIEFRFCLRDISKVSNISCSAAFVGVFRRFRRNVTVPSRSSAIKASIPVVVKQTMFKEMIIIFCADKDTKKYKAIAYKSPSPQGLILLSTIRYVISTNSSMLLATECFKQTITKRYFRHRKTNLIVHFPCKIFKNDVHLLRKHNSSKCKWNDMKIVIQVITKLLRTV